jgi:glycosyltransferase involved in cell wall biosynthesis
MPPRTKRHRIAILFEHPTLLGGERSMLACVDWLKCQDADLEFVAIAPKEGRLADALTGRGIEIIPCSTSRTDASVRTRDQVETEVIAAVIRSRGDLLHANSLSMGRLTGRIADRLTIPTSSHVRDILKLSHAAMADLNRNQLLIAVSQATRDAHQAKGMDPQRVIVVTNGLDLAQFQPRPDRGLLKRELGLPENAFLIATIGQIGLRKGQDVLAEAAPEIVRAVPDSHFLLIGERTSTKVESIEFEQGILQRFNENNLRSHLHCLGHRDDVPELLSEIAMIVHPAQQEPYGRVLLEAAACGVPVVATNVGGTAEIVLDGLTGRLVPPRNPEALANAVIGLATNRSMMQSMGLAARERAMSEFDIARSVQRLVDCWHTILRTTAQPTTEPGATAVDSN